MLSAREFVEQMFPRRAFAPASAVGRMFGLAPQTTRNNVSAGTFPVETVRIGNKRVVPIPALIEFLEKNGFAPSPAAEPVAPFETPKARPRGRPGRPRKYPAPAAAKEGSAA